VVAADESIAADARTFRYLAACSGSWRGIVALTKADLVDDDILGLVRLELEELVAGSFLEGAPIVPVSSVTGAGLDDLRRELASVAATVPEKNAGGHFRLPIDRVFSIRDSALVTGTLSSPASVAREQEWRFTRWTSTRVRRSGTGARRGARWRDSAQRPIWPTSSLPDLTRGDSAQRARALSCRETDRCALHLLPSAKPLKHRAPVHFHAGTAEIEAEVRLLEGRTAMRPGTGAWVRIVLRDAALVLPGDRFIIRMFSPVITIGGGVVADVSERRYRKADDPGTRLGTLTGSDTAARLTLLVREQPFGMSLADLVARTGLTAREIARAQKAPLPALVAIGEWHVDRDWMQSARNDGRRSANSTRRIRRCRASAAEPREGLRNLCRTRCWWI
jgi:selenocysteine-specific elongation factor